MTFICYPKCTTCQKARKWLDDLKHTAPEAPADKPGVEYTIRDIKEGNSAAHLKASCIA
jgi:arsenate reductase